MGSIPMLGMLPRFGVMQNGAAAETEPHSVVPSDEVLARRVQTGDIEAFTILVERYQRLVLNIAYRMLGDPDEAQDTAQDVFVKVYQQIDQFDPERRFYSWLYRITVNTALRARRRPATFPLDPLTLTDQHLRPDELAERAEQDQALRAALLALPERERAVIGLRYGADLAYDQIAETLQVPLGTVKTRLFRAKERLAHVLERGDV